MAAGDIAVNNSPGNLRCNAVIFAVCCEWDNGGARQVEIIPSHCVRERKRMSLTLSPYLSRNVFALQFELVATQKTHTQLGWGTKRAGIESALIL